MNRTIKIMVNGRLTEVQERDPLILEFVMRRWDLMTERARMDWLARLYWRQSYHEQYIEAMNAWQ